MTDTTDPVEAVARAFAEAPRPEIADTRASIDAESLAMAEAAMRILTALGAVMPDEAAKLRADLAATRAEAVRYRSGELQALARLGDERNDVLALCRPTRGDTLAGVSAEDRLRQIEARLTREAAQSHEEAPK